MKTELAHCDINARLGLREDLVGVVTVTYNSEKVIHGFLSSLLAQNHRAFRLYLVDNASSDGTLAALASYSDDRIQVVSNAVNLGIAEANNQGVRAAIAAGCNYILLMNNDTEFDADLLTRLLAGLYRYGADIVTPKIVYHDNPHKIWSAGGGLNPLRGYCGFHHGYDQEDRGQFQVPCKVDHAPGCCVLMHEKVFQRVGFLDPHYFTYVEDTDFSYRANRSGLTLMYIPDATVLHKAHSLTGGRLSKFMMRYTTRNRVYFLLKHFGPLRGLYYIPAYQLHLLAQSLFQKTFRPLFWLRERAFFEGLHLWLRSSRTFS